MSICTQAHFFHLFDSTENTHSFNWYLSIDVMCVCVCIFWSQKISVATKSMAYSVLATKRIGWSSLPLFSFSLFCLHSMLFDMKMVCFVTLFLLPFTIQCSTFFPFLCDTFATFCANKQAYASKGVLICFSYTHKKEREKEREKE